MLEEIEKKLQETPYYKTTRSYSKPGESLIFLELLDTAPAREVSWVWIQVRKKLGDIHHTLPPEALVDGGTWTTIRRRQTLDELLQLEA